MSRPNYIFLFLSTGVISLTWYSLLLTEFKVFNLIPILSYILIFTILFFFFLIKNKKLHVQSYLKNKFELIVIGYILVFSIFNAFYAHETFFGGRDDGVYSNSAIYLSKNHNLIMSPELKYKSFVGYKNYFENLYQPEFHYTFINWLAINYTIFGINGILWSNLLPLVLALFSIYLIAQEFGNKKAGLLTVIFLSTSYLILWFSRRSLTEILSLFMVWFGIYCLVKLYKSKNENYIYPALLSFGLFLHTRFEAIYVFVVLILLLVFCLIKKYLRVPKISFLILLLIVIHFTFYSLRIQPNYNDDLYSSVNQIAIKPFNKYVLKKAEEPVTVTERLKGIDKLDPNTYVLEDLVGLNIRSYLIRTLTEYNIFIFVILLVVSVLMLLKSKKDKFLYLLPVILNIPIFILFVNPYNSPDMPWFIRRFLPQIFPFAVLYACILLGALNSKTFKVTIVSLLLIINFIVSSQIIFFKDNKGLMEGTQSIANTFEKSDYILVDGGIVPTFPSSNLADPLYFIYDKNVKLVREGWAFTGEFKNGGIDDYFNMDINNYIVTNANHNWFNKYFEKYNLVPVKTINITYNYLENLRIDHLNDFRNVYIGPYYTKNRTIKVVVYKISSK